MAALADIRRPSRYGLMELADISAYKLPYFNVGGLARFLDLDPETILVLVKKGDLPAQRVDGHLIFGKKKINRWLIESGRDEGES